MCMYVDREGIEEGNLTRVFTNFNCSASSLVDLRVAIICISKLRHTILYKKYNFDDCNCTQRQVDVANQQLTQESK